MKELGLHFVIPLRRLSLYCSGPLNEILGLGITSDLVRLLAVTVVQALYGTNDLKTFKKLLVKLAIPKRTG